MHKSSEGCSKISKINDIECDIDDWNKPVQSDYFNILEYLIYVTGFEYDHLLGAGYNDRNTLFPHRNNDVWRIYGPEGAIDQFTYNFETGRRELERCIKADKVSCYFIFGRGRESRLINSQGQVMINAGRINLLSKILMSRGFGIEVSELSKIWDGTTDPKGNTKSNRRELNQFLGTNVFYQPSKTRWAIKKRSKIIGLIKVDFLN